jgi:hypothetical protein
MKRTKKQAKPKPVELKARAAGKPKRVRHGPEPERLKLEGDFETLVDTALKKQRPPGGWPKG